MDEIVKKALKKWPDVPHAYGWISLNQSGKWRFHLGGDFKANPGGESIDNPQIAAFLGRNYEVADNGSWFIQNGPQRAYVTLPFAPLIMRLDETAENFVTHNGLQINKISHWFIDENGHIYALSNAGPCMLDAHDLQHFIDHCSLQTEEESQREITLDEDTLGRILSTGYKGDLVLGYGVSADLNGPLEYIASDDIPRRMGFVRFPAAPEKES